jgi:hypothetical protein
VLLLTGTLLLSREHAGDLLNFGTVLRFMGVNLAAFRQFFWRKQSALRILPPFPSLYRLAQADPRFEAECTMVT